MGFLELLTIVFIVLKLISVIDWSWWLVFSPLYVYILVFGVYIVLYTIGSFLVAMGVRSTNIKHKRLRDRMDKK